ncbi:bifunctional diaminohydroxyphosphoribosylaminopyrimidine deaminase/5-amino-6-(5-phosphoribosylamino)uracil reductase RibD [Caulobacter sp. 17J80-11]|uniref:bifunctional diaminohydroxyphosphoribosylaminopyrimidine deaminase/5-amino-6-(5-phosphoribosylamino)uracil reductase RibD n=1 Tax=Caulobacter sp. 17J80-11 TaxID=2763502 RepID=UPI0021067346|nr:bifunctional diaminohydroxyphosphoribosylaminopyrimidine deaminase/5-amino-6-(5-phosphoribosylamino)uracil reductase RibD [Caulobacter sp. 17J80-11]
MSDDVAFMRRAIAVARVNLGKTRPNPVVGCVLVKDGVVLAEAATGEGGRPHAEELALAAAGDAARGATAYVTLEPCGARSSGAPSCAERLALSGVARVMIACEDPSPFASGQGIERLTAAGVPFETGLLADEAAALSEGFVHRMTTGRPLVAESDDGDGFDGPFEAQSGEDLDAALVRLGAEGWNRLWVPRAGELAARLRAQGVLA